MAEIKALEDRRYPAMLASDTAVLDELCSDDLTYPHSKPSRSTPAWLTTREIAPPANTTPAGILGTN
jgi:hypothetical protein